MTTSEAQKRATSKYLKEKLEGITFRVPKGVKAIIQKHAMEMDESMNAFILRSVMETIANDKKNPG